MVQSTVITLRLQNLLDSAFKKQAEEVFGELGTNKIVSGSRFLGGYVGNSDGREEYVRWKVNKWGLKMSKLVKAADSQPQATYVILVKSLQHEWAFVQRF